MNIWLGKEKGYLTDWITQKWVRITGKKVKINDYLWLASPTGNTDLIGDTFIQELAIRENLNIYRNNINSGLIESIEDLNVNDNGVLKKEIIDFYENTINYEYEVWSKWNIIFLPFGILLNKLFSKRLQQLNLPLDPLDNASGIKSEIIQLKNENNETVYTIWYRTSKLKKQVIYSGVYATCILPHTNKKYLKVVFPLPNGNAMVLMSINVLPDGSLDLRSEGQRFGESGFYFVVNDKDEILFVKYLKSLHENIHVYLDNEGILRAEHNLFLWGFKFLKLHYRINKKVNTV